MKHYDFIFAGGGGSSLALLLALHKLDGLKDLSVLIIEPETKNSNDRTWCFWTDKSDSAYQLVEDVIDHRWNKIKNVHQQVSDLNPFEYIQVRSAPFYAKTNKILAQYPHIHRISEKVISLEENSDSLLVNTAVASFTCNKVFDSRPPKLNKKELLWQSFVGLRITSEEAVFNTDTCTLMDFEVPQNGALQFMYVLPTENNKSLVEFTRFGSEVLSKEEALPIIEKYIRHLGIRNYEIDEWEIDKIPMTLELNRATRYHSQGQRCIPIGIAAGNAKASTGFAFKNILKHSASLAESLVNNGEKLARPVQKMNFRYYDELLLRLLNRKPEIAKKLFVRLFEKHPVPRILRFLDEETHLYEDLQVMYQMPWLPFFWSIKEGLLQGGSIAKASEKNL
jgi:lycopene beta-cyclase